MQLDENKVTYFAETDSRNHRVRFGIKAKDRTRHMYVIGKTGMGKSTLLENLAIQDIQNGAGLAVIDPHGSFADKLLDYVPEHRIKDVLYFAPFDMDYPVSFNVMEDVGADKRHLVANGLMSAFKKIWVDAWSARMEYILNNTILALLEYPDSTLIGVNRMLSDKEYRKKVVDYITDPSVKSFWTDEFANYTERMAAEATPAIQNKIGQFISNPIIRNIIGQPKSTFDFRDAMDTGKIVIINLSKGRIGEASAQLLGSILVTKIYLAAMSRADLDEQAIKASPNFYLFVDEFQSFANESFADILSEARKYKLNLTIAHQYIEQMPEEVRSAVFGNVGTMITFRVGAIDAEVLEKEFAPQFMAADLVNLGFAQIYLKLMIDGVSSQPFSASTIPPLPKPEISYREQIIEYSRKTFAEPREKVEEEIKRWHQEGRSEPKQKGDKSFDKKGGHQDGFKKPDRNGSSNNEGKPFFTKMVPQPGPDFPKEEKNNTQNHSQGFSKPHNQSQTQIRSDSKQQQPQPQNHSRISSDQEGDHRQGQIAKKEEQKRRERELREAVSLSSLKKSDDNDEREKKKELSPENANALKTLLGQVLGQEKVQEQKGEVNQIVTKTPVPTQMQPEIKKEDFQPKNVSTSEVQVQATPIKDVQSSEQKPVDPLNREISEVPRPVLEQMLRLDEDGSNK